MTGTRLRIPGRRTRTTAQTRDSGGVTAAVAPTAVEVLPCSVRVGDGYAATLVVTGYPAEVGPGWTRVEFRPDTPLSSHALSDSGPIFSMSFDSGEPRCTSHTVRKM